MIVVPIVLVGYIYVVEYVVGAVLRRTAARIRPWLWLAPTLVFLGVFLVYPTISTIIRSFQNRRGDAFVGLENFQWFFSQQDTLIALRNNVLWVIFLPLLVSASGCWSPCWSIASGRGCGQDRDFPAVGDQLRRGGRHLAVHVRARPGRPARCNGGVTAVGGEPHAWLVEQPQNNFFLIIVGVWLLTGFAMVILSAGLKGISTELLEAARVDGANEWQVFRKIISPLLLPTIAVIATTIIIYALKTFDVVYTMTNGNFQTDVIANTMYQMLFNNGQPRRAAAIAVILFLAIVPVMIVNIRRFRAQEAVR